VTDERLQDYLDGRLDDDARAEVEARLAKDPELARRVETWREAGRALRDDPAELPPGFYARARDRFEKTAGAPRGFRLLSWETAGLAAAVVLVAALFGPELMRSRDAAHPSLAPAVAEPDLGRADLPAPGAASPEVQPNAQAPPPAGRRAEKKMRAALEEAAPDEERSAPADFAPAPGPAPEKETAPKREAEAASREARESFAEVEPMQSGRRDEAAGKSAPRAPQMAAADASTGDEPESATVVVPLAADPRIPHGLRVVEDAVERADWLAGPLARLSAEAQGGRLVLVGHDGGADCGSLTVRRVGESYQVRLARPGAAAGCGFVLPRDGLAVTLED